MEIGAYEAYLRGALSIPSNLRRPRPLPRNSNGRRSSIPPSPGPGAISPISGGAELDRRLADAGVLAGAEEHARRAVALDPKRLRQSLGPLPWSSQHPPLRWRATKERAAGLNPNDADLLAEMAETLVYRRRERACLEQLAEAMRRNPFHPDWYRWVLGWALFGSERFAEVPAELDRMNWPPCSSTCCARAVSRSSASRRRCPMALKRFLAYRPGWSLAKEKGPHHLSAAEDRRAGSARSLRAGLPRD